MALRIEANRELENLEAVLGGGECAPFLKKVASVEDAIAADAWGREQAQSIIAAG